MITKEKSILVGQIISPHGINGAVKIRSYTEIPEKLFDYELFLENKKLIKLQYLFIKLPNLICKINDINNRNEVENFIGLKIFTNRDTLPKVQEDEFYIADLLNLTILDQNNEEIGKVINVLNYGAGDLIEVKFIDGKSEILQFTKKNFPFISSEYIVLNKCSENE